MQILRSRRGTGLVDVMLSIFLLSVIGLIFSACFPAAVSCSKQAQQYKIATTIAEEKMEEIRSISYETITRGLLLARGSIDETSTNSVFDFTDAESIATQLPDGEGELVVTLLPHDVKQLQLTVSWEGAGGARRQVRLLSMVADKRPHVE